MSLKINVSLYTLSHRPNITNITYQSDWDCRFDKKALLPLVEQSSISIYCIAWPTNLVLHSMRSPLAASRHCHQEQQYMSSKFPRRYRPLEQTVDEEMLRSFLKNGHCWDWWPWNMVAEASSFFPSLYIINYLAEDCE